MQSNVSGWLPHIRGTRCSDGRRASALSCGNGGERRHGRKKCTLCICGIHSCKQGGLQSCEQQVHSM